jgi:acyl-CoA thioesterase FadM
MRLPPRRIALADTDATGAAYAGRLADLCLQRLEEALARGGLDSAAFARSAAGPVVARLACDYRAPLLLGARASATVTCASIGDSSATFRVLLGRAVTAEVVLVWVERAKGASAPWPAAIRRRLRALA